MVTGLNPATTEPELREFFSRFGPLMSVNLHHRFDDQSPGTAEIAFQDKLHAAQARSADLTQRNKKLTAHIRIVTETPPISSTPEIVEPSPPLKEAQLATGPEDDSPPLKETQPATEPEDDSSLPVEAQNVLLSVALQLVRLSVDPGARRTFARRLQLLLEL